MHGRVQIAGVKDIAEAQMLADADVDDIGLPLGPGVRTPDTDEETARAIAHSLRQPQSAVLITYLSHAQEIAEFCRRLHVHKVQLHADIHPREASALKTDFPELYVIKSLVVGSRPEEELLAEMRELEPWVDAFITDTYDPITGARGATGKTHDWEISRRFVSMSHRPVILAGGLTPENVAEAIRRVGSAAVDSHTGVEAADGRKDPERVKRFVAEARRAFALKS